MRLIRHNAYPCGEIGMIAIGLTFYYNKIIAKQVDRYT